MVNPFISVFAQEMQDHLSLLDEAGWYVKKAKCYLRSLDRYMVENKVSDKVLEERLVSRWLTSEPVKAETKRNMYSEINRFTKAFRKRVIRPPHSCIAILVFNASHHRGNAYDNTM